MIKNGRNISPEPGLDSILSLDIITSLNQRNADFGHIFLSEKQDVTCKQILIHSCMILLAREGIYAIIFEHRKLQFYVLATFSM